MNFTKAFWLVSIGIIGGVLGNLFAGFIQNDLWDNVFTTTRVGWTFVGIAATVFLTAWLDTKISHNNPSSSNDVTLSSNVTVQPQVFVSQSSIKELEYFVPTYSPVPAEKDSRDAGRWSATELIGLLNRERARLIFERAVEHLRQFSHMSEIEDDFRLVFLELTNNAFEHGCLGRGDDIYIHLELTPYYVVVEVVNAPGVTFDLRENILTSADKLRLNPLERRGRGLLAVYRLSDTLETTLSGDGMKACLYHPRVKLNVVNLDNLRIIEVLGGLHNPSLVRRLLEKSIESASEALIIHFPSSPSTQVGGLIIDIHLFYEKIGKFVLLCGDNSEILVELLPRHIVAFSWEEALDKVGKSNFRRQITTMLRKGQLLD